MNKLAPVVGWGLLLVTLAGCFFSEQRRLDHLWPAKYESGSLYQMASVEEG